MMTFVISAVVITMACGVAVERIVDRGSPPGPAQALAPLEAAVLARLDGGVGTLERYIGKVVVVNVWATWCAPCRRELPSLQRLSDALDADRFAVVGVSVDHDPDFVREYLRDHRIGFDGYVDRGHSVTRRAWSVDSYPQTLIIGPDGLLAQRVVGERRWDDRSVVATLETLSRRGRSTGPLTAPGLGHDISQ